MTGLILIAAPAFARRVLAHDAARKGLLSAAAGLFVAAICESVWPSAR